MNPYREKTSEWYAFEQGLLLGRNQFATTLGSNALYGKLGSSNPLLDSFYFDTQTGERMPGKPPTDAAVMADLAATQRRHDQKDKDFEAARRNAYRILPATTAREKIIACLREKGSVRLRDIMRLGEPAAIKSAMIKMLKKKEIRRMKYGTYALREKT